MADSAGGVDEAVMGLSCVGEYGSAVGVEGGGNETDDGDCGADVTGRTCTAGTRMSAAASCAISYAGSGSWRRGGVRENSWGRECIPQPTTVIRTGAGPSYEATAASAGLGGVPWVLVGRLALAASRRGGPTLDAVYTDMAVGRAWLYGLSPTVPWLSSFLRSLRKRIADPRCLVRLQDAHANLRRV